MVYAAAVTPFQVDGKIDFVSFTKLTAWLKAAGCDGLVVAGTTGEGPSLSGVEKRDLVRHAASHSLGMDVFLGVASNSLDEVIWLVRQARDSGAQGALVFPPTFFREYGQAGLIDWYTRILDSSPLPILLYNFPKRAAIEIEAETLSRLAGHPNLLGLKDSSGKVSNLADYRAAALEKSLFVGDETLLVDSLESGWTGTISGSSNLLGAWIKAISDEFATSPSGAKTKLEFVKPMLRALRGVPQPHTHKFCLAKLGIIEARGVRSPLLEEPDAELAVVWELLRPILGSE